MARTKLSVAIAAVDAALAKRREELGILTPSLRFTQDELTKAKCLHDPLSEQAALEARKPAPDAILMEVLAYKINASAVVVEFWTNEVAATQSQLTDSKTAEAVLVRDKAARIRAAEDDARSWARSWAADREAAGAGAGAGAASKRAKH
jgi:hypothetical protein